jgi:hypothetical protein
MLCLFINADLYLAVKLLSHINNQKLNSVSLEHSTPFSQLVFTVYAYAIQYNKCVTSFANKVTYQHVWTWTVINRKLEGFSATIQCST